MQSSELFSKEWCDLIFENRNKDYGAYALRRQTGWRYRMVALLLGSVLAVLTGIGIGTYIYARSVITDKLKEAEDALNEMHRHDHKDGYELKFLSTARMLPATKVTPGAKNDTPEIVDAMPEQLTQQGTDGPIAYDPEQELITTPIIDTTGLGNEKLPIAKEKIVPTEVVTQVPEFPGGARAFMRWLDEHIAYPQICIDRKQQGAMVINFIVDTDGYATDFDVKNAFDVQVFRSVMNALKRMPKWKPGTDEMGHPTRVLITVPIEFKLQ